MRTSGASYNDSLLVMLVLGIALGILVVLAGGPHDFVRLLDDLTRAALDAIGALAQ